MKTTRTPAGEALSNLMLDFFKLYSLLQIAGDRLVVDLGLTSARWQILATVVASERPQPVAWLARDRRANRQNVQRIVNDLEKEGLVTFEVNPHHRRAQLVVLSEKGRQVFDSAMRLQAPWINNLSEGLVVEDVETMHSVIATLRRKLEDEPDDEELSRP